MKLLIVTCFAVALSANVAVENERLKRTNKVLTQALQELTVGEEAEVSDVLAMFLVTGDNVETKKYDISKPQSRSSHSAAARSNDNYYCTTGVACADVCCHSSCGECGGPGCSQRPGGVDNCCMIHITDNGRGCDSPTDTACLMPTTDQCWTESTDGRDLGGLVTETNEKYYVYDNLEYYDCVEKANAVDQEDLGWNYYFSYTEEVNNGLCKVLKPGETKPDISLSTQVNSHLYVNTCRPSIAFVNKHSSSPVYAAFDYYGTGFAADPINNSWIFPGNQRLYTGLDPFMQWAQIQEGSVIPQVGFFDGATNQYVLCEKNFSFTGGLKTYYYSANGCTTEDS